MGEEWKKVDGFSSKYEISNKGRLKSYANGILKGSLNKKGYVCYRMSISRAESTSVTAHKLVAQHFIAKPTQENLQIDHIDGNKLNNNYWNLEWVTLQENVKRAQIKGRYSGRYGEKSSNHLFDDSKIWAIWESILSDKSGVEISKKHHVEKSYSSKILSGQLRKDIHFIICLQLLHDHYFKIIPTMGNK